MGKIHKKSVAADSENLVRAPFKKKNWVAGPQQPWSIASGAYNRDGARNWSCTVVHTPIICRDGPPRLLPASINDTSPRTRTTVVKPEETGPPHSTSATSSDDSPTSA